MSLLCYKPLWSSLGLGYLYLALLSSSLPAEEVREDDWQFDIVYRTKGRAPLEGLVVLQTGTHVQLKMVYRKTGQPTVVLEEAIPLADVARVKMLGPTERDVLIKRLEQLDRERKILAAQVRLWKGGKVELPPNEALALKPIPWGEDGQGKGLLYESTHFRLHSNARDDLVHLTAIQLEQVFAAYVRLLPPRRMTPQPTTIVLTASIAEYIQIVKKQGRNLLNPAFYDARNNQVICGSDLERLGEELEKAKEYHDRVSKDLKKRKEQLEKVYNGQVPIELWTPLKNAFEKIREMERKNNLLFKKSHQRLLQCLFHEAFHAYVTNSVFAEKELRLPVWMDEGLAQLFENAPLEGGEFRLGPPDPRRRQEIHLALKKNALAPLVPLLKANPRDFQVAHASEKQVSDCNYLTSWALAYVLTFDRQLLGTPALVEYVESLQRGVDPLQAFSTLVGQSVTEFEKDFHETLRHLGQDGISRGRKPGS